MIQSLFTQQHHLSNVMQKMLHQYLKWQQNWCSLPLWGLLQDLVFHSHRNVLLQKEHSTLFAAGLGLPDSHSWLVAGPGVPHSQECGPTPDHCQEAQPEGLGSQQEAGLEGMARQQEAHQCIPLLTSGLPHCSPFQCLESAKRILFDVIVLFGIQRWVPGAALWVTA